MDKKVIVKNVVNFRAMKYFYMYNLKSKNFMLIYALFAGLCFALAGVALVVPLIKGEAIDWFLPVALAAFSAYLLYTLFTIEKKIDSNIAQHFASRRPSEQIVRITEESVTVSYANEPDKEAPFDWVQITKIHEIPQYYYLFAGRQLILIDKDPNALLEGDFETLTEIIKEKIAVKPYKLFNKELVTKPITYVHQEFAEDVEKADEVEHTEVTVEAAASTVEEATAVEEVVETPEENKEEKSE
ncbi:MAG: hypothetical protein PHY42_06345 [Bacilli bacterium]|nr:hypothetical protein [Bacilli bacterium]